MKNIKLLKIFSLLTLGLGLVSCSGKDTSPSRELNVYTALENEQIPAYLKSFKKAHPDIKLNIIRDSTGVIISRLLAERDNPKADVIWGTAVSGVLSLDKFNLLKPYSPKGIENLKTELIDQSSSEPKWVGNNAWMTAVVVNSIELKKLGLPEPSSYADLVNPIYKDLISMPNPASSGTGYLTVAAWLQIMGEDNAWQYMSKLHNNIGIYTNSGSKPAKSSAAGEYPIGITYGYPGVKIKNDGAPVNVYFPKEGSGWDSEGNALINKTEIKEEAKIFLDWAVSESVMREYGKSYGIISRKIDVPIPKGFPSNPEVQLIKNDFKWMVEQKERVLRKWEENFGSKTESK